MYISDLTKPDQYAYHAKAMEGTMEVMQYLQKSSCGPGYRLKAYEFSGWSAYNTKSGSHGRLGKNQKARAQVLRRELKRAFVEALEQAGWRCQVVDWAGMKVELWLQPEVK